MMRVGRVNSHWTVVAFILLCALLMPAGAERAEAGGRRTIEFWSMETQPERIAITQAIIDEFTAETSIEVVLVAVSGSELAELVVESYTEGTLPDVIHHPVDHSSSWAADGILDANAARAVIRRLGANSFSKGALGLVLERGKPAAVPATGWGQVLIYRTDLFAAYGLESPTSFAAIRTAAEALHDPDNGFFGITAGTNRDIFTQQTFEHFALANGCELVDDAGNVAMNSTNCVDAIAYYTDLLSDYGPGGQQDVVSTRFTYMAGNAAMVSWSPFMLDELAGLRDSVPPTCEECLGDSAFLARNSGLVGLVSGPDGDLSQYGAVASFGITTTASRRAAQRFVAYLLTDGYLDWLSMAPEGMVPMRAGTRQDPTRFVDAWWDLEIGVDRKAPFGEFYSDDALETLVAGAARFDRWGFAQNEGQLVSAVYDTLVVPDAILRVLDGELSPQQAADELQETIEGLRGSG